MNQKLRDDKDAIEAAHEAVSYVRLNGNHDQVSTNFSYHNEFMHSDCYFGEAIRFKVIP